LGYYERVSAFLDSTLALLERTPATLISWLDGLPDEWNRTNEGEGTFSPYDVIGHLIHGEKTDWIPRARIILEHGSSRPFDRYDRFAQLQESAGRSLGALLSEFDRLRRENLTTLRNWKLSDADLERGGMHPVLGPVTLRQLLATWAAHDMTHVHQIARTMAFQYRDAVGPWVAYLGVMHCDGHSQGP
jgi:DinB family protein